jgi:hypothetical protein
MPFRCVRDSNSGQFKVGDIKSGDLGAWHKRDCPEAWEEFDEAAPVVVEPPVEPETVDKTVPEVAEDKGFPHRRRATPVENK